MKHIPISSSNYRRIFFEPVQVICRPFHNIKLNWNWILYFVDRDSCYDSWWKTNLKHNYFLCMYFNSLHVSSNLVLIIRSINCINTTSGICHCVSVTYHMLYWYNWYCWLWAQVCSKHVENWNKYIKNNCASSWSFTINLKLNVDSYVAGA